MDGWMDIVGATRPRLRGKRRRPESTSPHFNLSPKLNPLGPPIACFYLIIRTLTNGTISLTLTTSNPWIRYLQRGQDFGGGAETLLCRHAVSEQWAHPSFARANGRRSRVVDELSLLDSVT